MNILPKKNWHVRSKKNIEKVKRDEREAAEKEKQRLARLALAEQEARTNYLREKAKKRVHTSDTRDNEQPVVPHEQAIIAHEQQHRFNLFEDVESGTKKFGTNKEHEAEKKAEEEKQEMAIGRLTYLGQSVAVDAKGEKPWYSSGVSKEKDEPERDMKLKRSLDPMKDIAGYTGKKRKHEESSEKKAHHHHKHKKEKKKDKEKVKKEKSMRELREERLKRESLAGLQSRKLLSPPPSAPTSQERGAVKEETSRRYNSQYNPDFVRRPRQSRPF